MPPGPPAKVLDLTGRGSGAYGVFLYGPSRTVLLRVAFAFARANDPQPYWVTVRDPTDQSEPLGPVELGWITDDHLFIVSRNQAQPQDAVSNLALWTIVRSDEPQSVIGGLTDFLRLPPVIQEALSRYGEESRRPVFVVANTDRVRDYYPRDQIGVRAIVDAMLHSGVIPIFAACGSPGEGRFAFDLVIEVDAPDLAHWQQGALRCERSFDGAPLQKDQRIRLDSVPSLVAALQGQKDPPGTSAKT